MPQPASVNPETFLGDILGDYRYDASIGELSLQERLTLLLYRATMQGQDRHLQNSICPSNFVIPRELLRTVPCRGDGN
ncbi:unnamed protein product, partial [Ectocarpus sp. 12 AP-2014]